MPTDEGTYVPAATLGAPLTDANRSWHKALSPWMGSDSEVPS